jgi:hypothetical protein
LVLSENRYLGLRKNQTRYLWISSGSLPMFARGREEKSKADYMGVHSIL